MTLVFTENIEAGTYTIGNGTDHRLALTTVGNRNEVGPVWVDNSVFLWDIIPIVETDFYVIKVARAQDKYLTIDQAGNVGVGSKEVKYYIVFLGVAHYKLVNSEDETVLDAAGGLKSYVKAVANHEGPTQEWVLKRANVATGKYSVVDPDLFIQDGMNSDFVSIGPVFPRFGLKDTSPDRWTKFWARIAAMNTNDADKAQYKVVFLARATQATHECAINRYGFQEWYQVWSKEEGDDDLSWVDANITQAGYITALEVRQVWDEELAAGLGLPHISYTSPLTRALVTNTLTFGPAFAYDPPAIQTVVLEDCREHCTTETSNKRGTKTYIASVFPKFIVEDVFAEQDPIWSADKHESPEDIENRVLRVLDKVFSDDGTFVSITAHRGFVQCFMKVVGRQDYLMRLGGVIPIVIKHKL